MLSHDSTNLHLGPAPAERQAAALDLVFAQLSPVDRAAYVANLVAAGQAGQLDFDGLWEARRDDRLVGALWAQVQVGAAAGIWPPRLAPGEPGQTADRLLEAALTHLQAKGIQTAQTLLLAERVPDVEHAAVASPDVVRFVAAGFHHLADLVYLVSFTSDFPTNPPESALVFEPYTESNARRLAAVVEQTYDQTKDCPQLNGLRRIDDVLAEYRSTGVFDPSRWLIVCHENADVGCLLLADHPEVPQWELVYMGLIPSARGRGWGGGVIRHAQWLARQAGRGRLVLAVDSANQPAIDMYAHAGFTAWDRRSAYFKIFSS
jgi:mycothiol synthase